MDRALSVAAALLLPLASACSSGGGQPTGAACQVSGDCASGLCLPAPFSGGYCSTDCANTACGEGDACHPVPAAGTDSSFCLKACRQNTDCRAGYTCFQGGCQPACATDDDCGRGYGCAGGDCAPLSGAAVGSTCGSDGECASRYCEPHRGTCQIACAREGACPAGQTCSLDPVDTDGSGGTDAIHPICVPVGLTGRALGESCARDADCQRGNCQYGLCVTLCQATGQCPDSLSCQGAFARLDEESPPFKACLPAEGLLDFNLGTAALGAIGVPERAVSLGLYVEAKSQDIGYYSGVSSIDDPTQTVYSLQTGFYDNLLRYQPAEGASFVVVSNSPRVAFVPNSLYAFGPFSQTDTGKNGAFSVRARIKLAASPDVTSGHVSIHVFLTDLRNSCLGNNTLAAAGAHDFLGPWEQTMRDIYQQANVAIDEFAYFDVSAPNVVTQADSNVSPELDNLLKLATATDSPNNLELVVVKHINAPSQQTGFEVLGVAGGVPNPTGIPGTVHSGAALSLSSLCYDKTQYQFALTAAHELGHTLGLFHNVEQDGHTDQMSDTKSDGSANLMYWAENGGLKQTRISAQQAAAIVHNPVVK